ncbi:hypothetical protein [Anatilimnocola floriformis]|uniref:hypothetical protein n=1 Tax=Anatilimnocola floriformis TaxID=2948575 RepID=UPI0020C4F37A|nr:hypothetical protein [Anatilimnocola floriformis]
MAVTKTTIWPPLNLLPEGPISLSNSDIALTRQSTLALASGTLLASSRNAMPAKRLALTLFLATPTIFARADFRACCHDWLDFADRANRMEEMDEVSVKDDGPFTSIY